QSKKSFYSGLNGLLELSIVKGLYLKAKIYTDNFNKNESPAESTLNSDIYSIRPIGMVSLDYHRWKRFKKVIINYGVGLGGLYNKSTEKITKNRKESDSDVYFGSVGMNLDEVIMLDYPVLKNFGLI